MKMERWQLRARQAQPLEIKIRMTQQRIRQWYEHWNGDVYVAFSGGKDSTVLLNIVREMYSEVPAVFVNTGLQYPEVRRFALDHKNTIELRPKKSFREVIERWGWPVATKQAAHMLEDLQNPTERNAATCHLYLTGYTVDGRDRRKHFRLAKKWRYLIDAPFKISDRCCDVMKKNPSLRYQKETGSWPLIGTMVGDSNQRERHYLRLGCNAFNVSHPRSTPMAFWAEQDVLQYILRYDLPIASVYGKIVERDGKLVCAGEHNTGCVFCAFGVQYDGEPNRFQRLKVTHPKLWSYCMDKLGMREVLEFMNIPTGDEV